MVEISWMITDDIEGVSLEEFNTEWTGIYGYFEICINNRVLGFCPDRKLQIGEEGNEDILYWLTKLSNGIVKLNQNREYEIQLLSMNLTKIVLKNEDKLLIKFVDANTDEVIWSEKLLLQDWCKEIALNTDKFIAEIKNTNPMILSANIMQKLTDAIV